MSTRKLHRTGISAIKYARTISKTAQIYCAVIRTKHNWFTVNEVKVPILQRNEEHFLSFGKNGLPLPGYGKYGPTFFKDLFDDRTKNNILA